MSIFKKFLKKHTTTSEGSSVTLDAMVFWRIVDTKLAAERAMESLRDND